MKTVFHMLLSGVIFFCLTIPQYSCVSKKKYLSANQTIDSLTIQHEQEMNLWKNHINRAADRIDSLELQLAERQGENNILLLMQDKYQKQIETLEEEIESLSSRSQSSSQSLNARLKEKDQKIASLQLKIEEVKKTLDQEENNLKTLLKALGKALSAFDQEDYELEEGKGVLSLSLSSSMLFRKGNTSRIRTGGHEILEKIYPVLEQYPSMLVTVTGHTDNSNPPSTYGNNWNFSVLQAAAIANSLVKDYGLTPNQVVAAGKSEFAPRASNDSSEGRLKNQRVELLITPKTQTLARKIRKTLQ